MTSWDRADPVAAIAAAAARCSNWNRWGPDDVRGTLDFIDQAKRREGAAGAPGRMLLAGPALRRRVGPQIGTFRRHNPVHVMLASGLDSAASQHFPHGFIGADDAVFTPLQASQRAAWAPRTSVKN